MSAVEERTVSTHGAAQPRWTAIVEVAAFALLLTSYIWLWEGRFPGDRLLVVVLYFGIGLGTHWRRGETARDVGLRLDNLPRFTALAAACLAPIIAVLMGVGHALGGWAYPPAPAWVASLVWSMAWGTAQQYGLVAVFYRRLRELMGSRAAIVSAAVLFALLHLPNPFLVGLTLLLGMVACWLYERAPNLFGLGLVHGLTSFLLANALPGWLTFDWMVGPQILHRVAGLF